MPESGGSDARITVYSSGYPSYVANETADALSISYLPPTIDSVSATLVGTAGGDALMGALLTGGAEKLSADEVMLNKVLQGGSGFCLGSAQGFLLHV